MDPVQKIVHDFLCGNHSRNLLVDRANGFYDAYLERELGEAMRAASVALGGRVRLECSGVCFLRSICRLTHRGHAQYVKGDGDAFGDFLELNYPGMSNQLPSPISATCNLNLSCLCHRREKSRSTCGMSGQRTNEKATS